MPQSLNYSPRWRLQPFWLRDQEFIEFFAAQIDFFFFKLYKTDIQPFSLKRAGLTSKGCHGVRIRGC